MSTPSFLAWSFAVAGLCALLLWHLRRRAVANNNKVLPPLDGPQLALMSVSLFLASMMVVRIVCDLVATAPLPGWTGLIFGAMMVAVGLSHILDDTPWGTGVPSRRLLGAFILLFGTAILAMEGYHYAISLGTAASVRL